MRLLLKLLISISNKIWTLSVLWRMILPPLNHGRVLMGLRVTNPGELLLGVRAQLGEKSMRKHYKELFQTRFQYGLSNIDYHRINNGILQNGIKYQSVLEDSCTIVNRENGTVHARIGRRLFYEPEGLYDLSVVFDVFLTVTDESGLAASTEEDLCNAIMSDNESCASNILSRISLIIAQITSTAGKEPVILPPTVFPKDN